MKTSEIIKIVLATANEIRKTEEKPVNWEPKYSLKGIEGGHQFTPDNKADEEADMIRTEKIIKERETEENVTPNKGSDWDIDKISLKNSLLLITKRLDKLEVKINSTPKQVGKKRGPYKKKSKLVDEKDRKVTIVKGFDSKAFGVRTYNKINSKIKDALISNRFTPVQIISEVKKKHPTCSEFSGNELLRHIKLAKGRLYSRIRDYNDVKPTTLGDINPGLKSLKRQLEKAKK